MELFYFSIALNETFLIKIIRFKTLFVVGRDEKFVSTLLGRLFFTIKGFKLILSTKVEQRLTKKWPNRAIFLPKVLVCDV